MRSVPITLALLGLLACGEEEDRGPDAGPDDETSDAASDPGADAEASEAGDSASESPRIEVAGALTATLESSVLGANWSRSNDLTSLFHLPAGSASVRAGFTFTFKGPPLAGETYDQTLSDLTCALTVTRASDKATWDGVRAIAGETDQGTCSLSLTAVEESLDSAAQKQYVVHGTVQGSLPPKADTAAVGNVTIHATF